MLSIRGFRIAALYPSKCVFSSTRLTPLLCPASRQNSSYKPPTNYSQGPPEKKVPFKPEKPKRIFAGPIGDKIYEWIVKCMEWTQRKKEHAFYFKKDRVDTQSDYQLVYHSTAHKVFTWLICLLAGNILILTLGSCAYTLRDRLEKRKRGEFGDKIDPYDWNPEYFAVAIGVLSVIVTIPMMFAASRIPVRMYYSIEKENYIMILHRPFVPFWRRQVHCKAGKATYHDEGIKKIMPLEVDGKLYAVSSRYFWFPIHFNVLLGYVRPSNAKTAIVPKDWHFKHWWVEANEATRRGAFR